MRDDMSKAKKAKEKLKTFKIPLIFRNQKKNYEFIIIFSINFLFKSDIKCASFLSLILIVMVHKNIEVSNSWAWLFMFYIYTSLKFFLKSISIGICRMQLYSVFLKSYCGKLMHYFFNKEINPIKSRVFKNYFNEIFKPHFS